MLSVSLNKTFPSFTDHIPFFVFLSSVEPTDGQRVAEQTAPREARGLDPGRDLGRRPATREGAGQARTAAANHAPRRQGQYWGQPVSEALDRVQV